MSSDKLVHVLHEPPMRYFNFSVRGTRTEAGGCIVRSPHITINEAICSVSDALNYFHCQTIITFRMDKILVFLLLEV